MLTELDHARHPMELLDMLRFWLGASKLKGLSSSLASSIEHTLSSYLEAMIGCRVGHGSGYEEAIRDATRIARQLGVKDREDVAMLLSACSLAQGGTEGPSDVVVLTADRGIGALLERLRGYDACFTGVTVRLVA